MTHQTQMKRQSPRSPANKPSWLPGFYGTVAAATSIWLRHARAQHELHRLGSRDLADLGLWRADG